MCVFVFVLEKERSKMEEQMKKDNKQKKVPNVVVGYTNREQDKASKTNGF